jgi:hypothetical protein
MNNFKKILIAFSTILIFSSAFPQVAINTNGASADNSAMLDIYSTSKGLLIPRMTTIQREAITSPATGLFVYDTDVKCLYYYNGTAWYTFVTTSGVFSPSKSQGKSMMTPEGGFAVKLINKSGNTVKKGSVVSISTTDAGAFILPSLNTKPVGIVYEDILNNNEGYIVVSGIAQVLIKNNLSVISGDLLILNDINGRTAKKSDNNSASGRDNFEIGTCIESKTQGTDVLVKIIINLK